MMSDVRETSAASIVVRLDQRRGGSRVSQRSAAEPADRSGVSERGRELAAALDAVRSAPDTRTARVAVLKAAIANGTYQPDPRAIAKEILKRGL